MSVRTFDDLAAELVLSVMRCLETPTDLLNFILTSKVNHSIFCAARDSTIEAVIRNSIPSGAILDALAACEASEVSKLWWEHFPTEHAPTYPPPSASFRARRIQFIEAYTHRDPHISLLGSAHLLSLFKLWRIANDFVLDFRNRAFICATKWLPHLQPGWDEQISEAERSRLLRAFFRFEVFRRLFPEIPSNGSDDQSKQDFMCFLSLFSIWEIEEILSIHEYLVSFAKDVYRGLQDYLLGRLRCIGNKKKQEAELHGAKFEVEQLEYIKGAMELGNFGVLGISPYLTNRRFQYLVARGLPFLYWLARLPPNDGLLALDVSLASDCRSTFFELVYDTIGHPSLDISVPSDSSASESFGWRWVRRSGLAFGLNHLRKRWILRQTGFVFWDAARLIGGWRLPELSGDTICLPARARHDNDNDWDYEPTLEERFQNINVPKGFFFKSDDGAESVFRASERFAEVDEQGFSTPFSDDETTRFNIEY